MVFGFSVLVEGESQGIFKGEVIANDPKSKGGKFQGLGFDYAMIAPRDTVSGHATGRRQHQPIKFIKEWDAASPQFFQAAVQNETLTKVEFEFTRPDKQGSGKTLLFEKITLTNAHVAGFHQFKHMSDFERLVGKPELEEITLVFEKIEIVNNIGKTMAQDDWLIPV